MYDIETGFYYLQSRYCDPELGRFLNADAYASTGQGILGNNMFAYCGNNPVKHDDSFGTFKRICTTYINDSGTSYIYDQATAPFDSTPFGDGSIGENGCGVIATYNAMISLGDARTFREVYDFMTSDSSRMFLNGKMGTNPWAIGEYFTGQGYTVRSTYSRDGIELYSTIADACILLYAYEAQNGNLGAHYVEYSKISTGYIGRNTADIDGKTAFLHPSDYGYEGERFFVLGIFIFK